MSGDWYVPLLDQYHIEGQPQHNCAIVINGHQHGQVAMTPAHAHTSNNVHFVASGSSGSQHGIMHLQHGGSGTGSSLFNNGCDAD